VAERTGVRATSTAGSKHILILKPDTGNAGGIPTCGASGNRRDVRAVTGKTSRVKRGPSWPANCDC